MINTDTKTFTIRLADYNNQQDGQSIIGLLDQYACDPMGGGQPLSQRVIDNLIQSLSQVDGAFSVLCLVGGKAVGLANCFQGFSTFKCQSLINVHDVIVRSDYRGQGISLKMLEQVQHEAKERGCCKLTLEVLEGNVIAQSVYKRFGFDAFELLPRMGKAWFWQKII